MRAGNTAFGLTLLLGQHLPEQQIISLLEGHINSYKEAVLLKKPEEELEKLFEAMVPVCLMVITKSMKEDPMSIMDQMDKMESNMKLFDTGKQ